MYPEVRRTFDPKRSAKPDLVSETLAASKKTIQSIILLPAIVMVPFPEEHDTMFAEAGRYGEAIHSFPRTCEPSKYLPVILILPTALLVTFEYGSRVSSVVLP